MQLNELGPNCLISLTSSVFCCKFGTPHSPIDVWIDSSFSSSQSFCGTPVTSSASFVSVTGIDLVVALYVAVLRLIRVVMFRSHTLALAILSCIAQMAPVFGFGVFGLGRVGGIGFWGVAAPGLEMAKIAERAN